MADPHFAARNLITKGTDNIQDKRLNPECGFPLGMLLQIIPHFSPISDYNSSVPYQGGKEAMTSTLAYFLTIQRPQAETPFLLGATILAQMQTDCHFP